MIYTAYYDDGLESKKMQGAVEMQPILGLKGYG